MKKILISSASIMLLMTGTALAQDPQTSDIDQDGTMNVSLVDQIFGTLSLSEITQEGTKNSATVTQAGLSQFSSIEQIGENNMATVDQGTAGTTFDDNSSEIRQIGMDHVADVDQTGVTGKSVMIDQSGLANDGKLHDIGHDNASNIVQFDERNKADVYQDGSDNTSDILQDGLTNDATVTQTSSENVSMIEQFGTSNSALIDQSATDSNMSNLMQNGTGNAATVWQ